ncbi:MAG: MMPL family transporter [Planctomycetota bacterium]
MPIRAGPLAFLAAAFLAAAAALFALPSLKFSHDAGSLLRGDAQANERQVELRRAFGSDDIVLIAWSASVLDPAEFARLLEVTRAVESVRGLEDVYSLAGDNVPLPLDSLRGMSERDLATPESRAALAKALRASKIYEGTLYNSALDTLAIATTVAPAPEADRAAVIDELRAVLDGFEEPESPIHLAGVTALAQDASRYAFADLKRVGVIASIVALALLFLLCGSWRETLAVAVATALPGLYALGLAAVLGLPITAFGAALFPIVAVVGLTASVHLLNAFGELRRRGATVEEAAARARARIAAPTMLSLSSSALAFLLIGATGVPAIRDGGILVAMGLMGAFPIVLFGIPELLVLLKPPARRAPALRADRFILRLDRFGRRRRRELLVLGSLGLLVAMAAFPGARADATVFHAFHPDSRVARTYRFLDERLTAVMPADLVIRKTAGASTADVLRDLETVERELGTIEGIDSVMSFASLVRFGAAILGMDDRSVTEPSVLTAVLPIIRGPYASITHRFEDARKEIYRVKIRMRSDAPSASLDAIRSVAADLKSGDAYVTGLFPLAVDTAHRVASDLSRGVVLMLSVVVLIVGLSLRSWRLAAASVLPNLLPVTLVLGGAAMFGGSLGIAAVAAASVAIGLAVDDTLHLLFAVKRERRLGRDPERAVARSLRSVGRALVWSTIVLVAGLACLGGSLFVPTARFGIFTAAAAFVALLGDLLLLPAMLRTIKGL